MKSIIALLFLFIFSGPAFSQSERQYSELNEKLSTANDDVAKTLVPQIRDQYNSLVRLYNNDKKSLKQAKDQYKEMFSLLERLNPFNPESKECQEKNIDPLEERINKNKILLGQYRELLKEAKIKAEIMGNPENCYSHDCEAYVTGDVKECYSRDCKAYVTGDINECYTRDCKAYVTGDVKVCYSRDCKAYVTGDIKECYTRDCKAFISGDLKECYTRDCKALITGDAQECHTKNCRAYVSQSNYLIQNIKTKLKTFGNIPYPMLLPENDD